MLLNQPPQLLSSNPDSELEGFSISCAHFREECHVKGQADGGVLEMLVRILILDWRARET